MNGNTTFLCIYKNMSLLPLGEIVIMYFIFCFKMFKVCYFVVQCSTSSIAWGVLNGQ